MGERARTQFIRSARKIFQDYGQGGEGHLTQEEFSKCKTEVIALCTEYYMALRPSDLDAMFELVDYESSGRIEIEELLYGMAQLSADVRPMSVMELRHTFVRGLHGVNQQMSSLESRLLQMEGHLTEVLESAKFGPSSSTSGSSTCFVVPAIPAPASVPLPAPPRPAKGANILP